MRLGQVTAHTGKEKLPEALYGCHMVVIPAGVPRKPGMTRDDLFNINASARPALLRPPYPSSSVLCTCVPLQNLACALAFWCLLHHSKHAMS
jgi:hypothetical protein